MATMYDTGNPIPSNTMMDLSDNANFFDQFINNISGTALTRLGVSVPVLQQILAEINLFINNPLHVSATFADLLALSSPSGLYLVLLDENKNPSDPGPSFYIYVSGIRYWVAMEQD
jgi:hypothetical protein